MGNVLLGILLPRGWMGLIGRITGSFSLLALYLIAFDAGLAPTLQMIFDYYDRLVELVFTLIEPLVFQLLSFFQLNIDLMPHWRHVYILMGVYVFMSASRSFEYHPITGIYRAVSGLVISLAASLFSGAIQLKANDFHAYFTVAASPVIGIFIFNSLNGVWNATFLADRERHYHEEVTGWRSIAMGHVLAAARRTFVALTIIILAYQFSEIREFSGASLMVLAGLVLLMGCVFLLEGFEHAKRDRGESERLVEAYLRSSSYKLGASMVGYFVWTGLYLLLNVGLNYWGL